MAARGSFSGSQDELDSGSPTQCRIQAGQNHCMGAPFQDLRRSAGNVANIIKEQHTMIHTQGVYDAASMVKDDSNCQVPA